MRILCLGDIVGDPGRQALRGVLPRLVETHLVDFVVANAENASGGMGLTASTAKTLLELPIDVLTTGNHVWRFKELIPLLESEERILRPLNYPAGTPGRGYVVRQTKKGIKVGICNLIGRTFLDPVPCPFQAALEATTALKKETNIILVELHAEATSEKRAMGWHLAGLVSAVYGTHTHIPTADEEILAGATGYITDIGMTGPYRSVIGMRKEHALDRFLTLRPAPLTVASDQDDVRVNGILLDIDPERGCALSIQRIAEKWAPPGE